MSLCVGFVLLGNVSRRRPRGPCVPLCLFSVRSSLQVCALALGYVRVCVGFFFSVSVFRLDSRNT